MALNPAQQEWLQDLSRTVGGSAAIGAGGRSLLGLYQMLSGALNRTPAAPKPITVDVPYKVKRKSNGLIPTDDEPKMAHILDPGWWVGNDAQPGDTIPLARASHWAGGALGAGAGWLGINHLLNMKKKKETEEELEAAKQELNEAELGKFRPLTSTKLGSEYRNILEGRQSEDPAWQKVAVALDKLTDTFMSKSASLSDIGTNIASWYPMYALPAAAIAGNVGYNYARKGGDPALAKAEALRKQIEDQRRSRVAPMYAHLVPVDDEEEEAKPKLADYEKRAMRFIEKLVTSALQKRADEPGAQGLPSHSDHGQHTPTMHGLKAPPGVSNVVNTTRMTTPMQGTPQVHTPTVQPVGPALPQMR